MTMCELNNNSQHTKTTESLIIAHDMTADDDGDLVADDDSDLAAENQLRADSVPPAMLHC